MSRWTWHGGGLAAARARFGGDDWLDLSTGINPHPWPGAETLSIDWRRLPEEGDLQRLEEAAAIYFGCDPDHVCAVPGTEVGLRLVGEMLGEPAFHIAPTYRTHSEMIAGARALSLDNLAQADGATLVLANPNNPDGRRHERRDLLAILKRRGRAWLAIDEAFVDVMPKASLSGELRDDRRLILFRSFGKFFGLAGLRLGFVLGPRGFLASLRQRLGAWPLSTAAIVIGTGAYTDHAWIATMRDQLSAEAATLDAVLADAGLRPTGACPLFRLAETDAGAVFDKLASQAILTRPFVDHPRWLRFGLPGDKAKLARVAAALRDG